MEGKNIENKKWVVTCNRFVAFLDIEGFKDRVYREGHEALLKDLISFRTPINQIENFNKRAVVDFNDEEYSKGIIIKPVIFSDSILLISGNDSVYSLVFVINRVRQIIQQSFSIGIPLKGAIAYGFFTADFRHSLYFGKPLIDAYELQNDMLLYSAVLHHTVEQRLSELNKASGLVNPRIVSYKTPFKTGTVNHFLVRIRTSDENAAQLQRFYRIVSGAARCYVDNTLDYHNWLNNHDLHKKKEAEPPKLP